MPRSRNMMRYAHGGRSLSQDQLYSDFILGSSHLSKAGKLSGRVLASHLKMRTAVYAIGHEIGSPVKIGFSGQPRGRLVELQVGSAEELRFHRVCWLATKADATKLEAECHRFLKEVGCHLRGEWFDLDGVLAAKAIECAAVKADCKIVHHQTLLEMLPLSKDPLQGLFWGQR